MCAYAIRLARISVVVSGARSGDSNSAISGYAILTDATLLPNHPPPTVIRDVLAAECEALLKDRRWADQPGRDS
jgi:tRNA(Arg) A34 adenosine deaminase TadA